MRRSLDPFEHSKDPSPDDDPRLPDQRYAGIGGTGFHGGRLGEEKPQLRVPCPDFERVIELPDFASISLATQTCFAADYGAWAWPETPCCPPELRVGTTGLGDPCPAPSEHRARMALSRVDNHGNFYAQDEGKFGDTSTKPKKPTERDALFFGAALAVLIDNQDLVDWAFCLVDSWSPELDQYHLMGNGFSTATAAMRALFTYGASGTFPWHVTYVTHADKYPYDDNNDGRIEQGPTAWAFTYDEPAEDSSLGVILPILHSNWSTRRAQWAAGGERGFCAAVQYASIVLHELVHVVADSRDRSLNPDYVSPWSWTDSAGEPLPNQFGAIHEDGVPFPCWDEGRMTAILFTWAMMQRYPCLANTRACGRYEDLWRFVHSTSGV